MAWYDQTPLPGQLNEFPAAWIDASYLDYGDGFWSRFLSFLKIRAIYLFMFLPLTVVDLATSLVSSIVTGLVTAFTSDDTQDYFIGQMKKFETLFSKNFWAILASPLGLVWPKLTAFYFTPEKHDPGVTAGGDYHRNPDAELEEPQSVEDVQNIIRAAVREGKKVIPKGAGMSQGKQFLPDGKEAVVMDLRRLNTIEIDAKEKTARVGAGVIWSDLQQQANTHKLALKVMQASNVFSVGGSIGTNIHGWDHRTGMLSETILSMDVINAQGQLETVTPDDELFHHITGGLGLFGTVVSVTLKLTDNERLVERAEEIPIVNYHAYFQSHVLKDETKKMHLYRLSLDPSNLLGTGVAVSYEKENPMSAPEVTQKLVMEQPHGTRLDRILVNLVRRFPWMQNFYWKTEHDRLLRNDSPSMTTNEIMKPMINAMLNSSVSESEWLQEFFLPGDQLDGFLHDLGAILMEHNIHLVNASVRYVKQNDKSPLSYAHDGDRYAVVLCWNQSLREEDVIEARKWLRQAQELTIDQGGTYYLPYQHVSNPETFARSYPHAQEALAAKKAVDPNEVFSSGFYQKYLKEPKPGARNYFKEMMASEETKREFSGFLTNVLKRVDVEPFYTLLTDIMTYKDTHQEIYEELCRRLPTIMPSAMADLSHVLNSLSTIKGDLGAQARALLPDTVRDINGLVEIGYPGRFIHGFQSNYRVHGPITAVCEQEQLTDYIQTGYPRPYNHFHTLNYDRPDLSTLADNSADVVTCYVGLHHFPDDELDGFLEEIRRVLRPGGHFLLVDHDIVDEQSMCYAHMAHTVFNAVTGASVDEEMNERRDFKSMVEWRLRLMQHGLINEPHQPDVPMIRQGDPSRNRMVSVAKVEKPVPTLVSLAQKHGRKKKLEPLASDFGPILEKLSLFDTLEKTLKQESFPVREKRDSSRMFAQRRKTFEKEEAKALGHSRRNNNGM